MWNELRGEETEREKWGRRAEKGRGEEERSNYGKGQCKEERKGK